jgi:hypothetical protein
MVKHPVENVEAGATSLTVCTLTIEGGQAGAVWMQVADSFSRNTDTDIAKHSDSEADAEDTPESPAQLQWDPGTWPNLDVGPHPGPPSLLTEGVPYGPYSLARCIDLVGLSHTLRWDAELIWQQFKSLAHPPRSSAQREAITACTGIEAFENFHKQDIVNLMTTSSETSQRAGTTLPDLSMNDVSDPEMLPDLNKIYDAIKAIKHLIQRGSVVKAWVDISPLVKVAETICGCKLSNRIQACANTVKSEPAASEYVGHFKPKRS